MPEVQSIDYGKLHTRKRAIFNPKRTDNLKPDVLPFIGKTLGFQCAGCQSDDDPFPGQYIWWPLADGENTEGREYGRSHPEFHHWVPDEDLIEAGQ